MSIYTYVCDTYIYVPTYVHATHTHTLLDHSTIIMFQFFIQNKQMPLVFCSPLISLGIYSDKGRKWILRVCFNAISLLKGWLYSCCHR